MRLCFFLSPLFFLVLICLACVLTRIGVYELDFIGVKWRVIGNTNIYLKVISSESLLMYGVDMDCFLTWNELCFELGCI